MRMTSFRPRSIILAVLVVLAALLGSAPEVQAAAPRVLSATASVSPINALVVDITVVTDVPSDLVIAYGNESAGTFRVSRPSTGERERRVQVMRLRPETAYWFSVIAVVPGGDPSLPFTGTFTTGTLPGNMGEWRWASTGRPTFEMALSSFRSGGHTGFVAMDEQGYVVWYYYIRGGNQVSRVRQLPNGDFVGIVTGVGLLEVSPSGEVVSLSPDVKGKTFTHHDFIVRPDGHLLSVLDVPMPYDLTSIGGKRDALLAVPALRDVDLRTGRTTPLWNGIDGGLDPLRDVHVPSLSPLNGSPIQPAIDWLHVNAVTMGPSGNYLISSPFTDAVYSISPDFKRIEWRVGGTQSDFRFERPEDRFYFQHSIRQLPNGHLLLFDNGGGKSQSHMRPAEFGTYSRAVEYELNFEAKVIRKVWEYRHTPDISTPVVSSVERLANGNTLVNFGVAPVVLVEVDPQGRPVWELTYTAPAQYEPPIDIGAFSARTQVLPLDSVNGEVRIAR
jgi:hypothetical protein